MKVIFYSILTLAILVATDLSSAEIIPVWNRTIEGKVQDMEFLKGQNEILMLVGEGPNAQIQRRNPENGDLIHSFPEFLSSFTKFALTPDSLRFVHLNGNGGLLRSLDEKYSVLASFDIKQEDTIGIYYSVIAIDPIRPFAYVTTYGWYKKTNFPAPRGKVIVYNYETGEHVKDLTEYGEDEYTAIEVSHDGKYLATLNDNKAYLKVWNLETMELIINEPLFDPSNDDWCRAEDIYFSRVNSDIVYYSGYFTKKINSQDIYPPSIYTYNLTNKEQKIILPDEIYGGWDLIFLENESRILSTTYNTIGVINLNLNSLEWYNIPPNNIYTTKVKYSEMGNYFIGASSNDLSKFRYDSQSNVETGLEKEITLSPNPTTNSININLNSSGFEYIRLSIVDILGNEVGLIEEGLMNTSNYQKEYDVSDLPPSIYFIRLEIGNEVITKQFIKE